jgi:hypothetical protein
MKRVSPSVRRRLPALVALAASLAAPAHANLISNGSFETPLVPNGFHTNFVAGTNLGGWTVVGVDSSIIDGDFVQSGIAFRAQDGDQWLDLAGYQANAPTSGVRQTIATTAGTQYRLTFYVGSATDGVFFFPTTVDLSINGGTRTHYFNPAAPTDEMDWLGFSVDFIASGVSTVITFFNGAAANNFSTALDNVSVVAARNVPEPGTLLLAALGIPAMFSVRRLSKSICDAARSAD